MKKILSAFVIAVLFFSGCAHSTQSWAFNKMISWNGNYYVGSEDTVNVVGEKLGSVKYYSENEVDDQGDLFSNYYKVGTNFYEIPKVNDKDAIAIKIAQGKYVKADNVNLVLSRQSNNS